MDYGVSFATINAVLFGQKLAAPVLMRIGLTLLGNIKMNQASRKICAICGNNEATTLDHLPPKSIFPKPRPDDLITVPSCIECNNSASDLDEAFRLYLALHVGDLDDEITSAYFHEALRTYKHNKKLQREILSSAEPMDFTTPSGIYMGQGMKVLWNSTAHDAVIERIVRGLYFYHFDEVLPSDARISPKWFNRPDEEFLETLSGLKKNIVGNNQFVYLYGRDEENPAASIWHFEFYGRHWAGAHTGMNTLPKKALQPTAESGG